jgi:hypothetical protein
MTHSFRDKMPNVTLPGNTVLVTRSMAQSAEEMRAGDWRRERGHAGLIEKGHRQWASGEEVGSGMIVER